MRIAFLTSLGLIPSVNQKTGVGCESTVLQPSTEDHLLQLQSTSHGVIPISSHLTSLSGSFCHPTQPLPHDAANAFASSHFPSFIYSGVSRDHCTKFGWLAGCMLKPSWISRLSWRREAEQSSWPTTYFSRDGLAGWLAG